MTTIQKTIQIPESRQITVELPIPRDLPVGDMADITVTIAVSRKGTPTASLLELAGALADSEAFAGDSVEMIRKIRDEW